MAKVGLGLSDYWLIIRKRRWVAILCFLVVFLSVVINTQMQTPAYQAVSSIRIIERKSVSDMITEMVSWTSYDLMRSLPKVLSSRAVIEKVVYELGLVDENTPLEKLNRIVLSIQGAVKAENVENTNIIKIIAEHREPEMAAKIANTVAKVYIKVDVEEKNERAHNIRIFLEEQLAKSKQRLIKAENGLMAFKEKGEITGIAVIIQNNIAALEREKIKLRKIFTEKYPDVVKVNEQIEILKERLQTLPQSEIGYARVTREMEINERSYRQLQNKLEEARIVEAEKVEDVKIVNPATVPKTPIRPNKKLATTLGLVIGLVIGIFMSFVVETLDTSMGTIDDLESILKLPVLAVIPYMKTGIKKKTRWRDFLPSQLWIFKERKERGGKKPEAIEEMKQQLLIKYGQRSSVTEAYRILRTNIKVEELLKSDKRILLVTSTVPKEGKSITALNLALALAQDGYKTLLIDCDLRKAVIHKVFRMDKKPGLTDILLGSSKPEASIRTLVDMMMGDIGIEAPLQVPGLDNFNLLPCGKIVTNPAELLDSTKIDELFSNLKTQYNFLVLDSPPVLPVPDAIILGRKVADRLYLVYRAGYTSKMAVLRAKQQLGIMKIMPSGIILNSTTPESQIVSDYYHHYYHYRYYTEKEEEKKS